MSTVLIIFLFILLLIILGGVVYWKRDDFVGYYTDSDGDEGETCEINLSCKSPLVCHSTDLTCQPAPILEPEPTVWEINFDDESLAVDIPIGSGVFNSIPFQGKYHHTAYDGYVTIQTTTHLELDTGFPSVLNYGGTQSWILNFNTTVPDGVFDQMILSTNLEENPNQERTGVFINLYDNTIDGVFYSGKNIEVGNTSHDFGDVALENITHSYVLIIDYETRTIRAYFDGVLIVSNSLISSDAVDWSTCDNLFINANFPYYPETNCSYHKLAVYHRVLTEAEILIEYNNRNLKKAINTGAAL